MIHANTIPIVYQADVTNNVNNESRFYLGASEVVITWSWLVWMKFCLALLECRQCYKLFVNYILWLHVISFISTRLDPSCVLPGSRFAGTKFSHIIPLTRISGMKTIILHILPATSKTWTQILDLKNLDSEKRGKQLDIEKWLEDHNIIY